MQSQLVLPGEPINIDTILQQVQQPVSCLKMQQDLREDQGVVVGQSVGMLQYGVQKDSLIVGLSTRPTLYQTRLDDQVIGQVITKIGDYYQLDLGHNQSVLLGIYEFEGATKKNRPVLVDGTLVYCKVIQQCQHLKSKVSCKSKKTKKEWVTGEAYYGELKGGMLLGVKVDTARQLEKQGDSLFGLIGGLCEFEVCIGVNGRVWMKAGTANDTVVIYNILQQVDAHGLQESGQVVAKYKGFFSVNQQV